MKKVLSTIVSALVAVAFTGIVFAAQPYATDTHPPVIENQPALTTGDSAAAPVKKAKKKKTKKAKKARKTTEGTSGGTTGAGPGGDTHPNYGNNATGGNPSSAPSGMGGTNQGQ